MRTVYRICNIMQRTVLRLFADWRVSGGQNVPPMGPLIVVANHQSNIDPPLLGASLPRDLFFLAKETAFGNPAARWLLNNYGAYPLKRGKIDIAAIRWALNKLSGDNAIVLFPEGTRSPGKMKKALSGVTLLAIKSGAPILPVGITGTEKLGPILRVAFPTGNIRVNVGQVFSLPVVHGKLEKPQLDSMTSIIMDRIAALLPESYHGVYGKFTKPTNTRSSIGEYKN